MFVAWGDELGFLYNQPYAEIIGSKHPEALGGRFKDAWPEIWSDIEPLVEAALVGESSFRENLSLVMNRKGFPEQTWFTFSYSPVHDDNGAVAGLFCTVAETTGQVLAEAALSESETRFRSMADSSPVMMWVTTPTGHCSYLNKRWYEFTGQTPGAGEGYGWLDAVHPDDRDAAGKIFVTSNAEHRDYQVEFRIRRADGAYRWAIDAAAARFSETGEFLGYVGSLLDIDERREMERALREANEGLEARVSSAIAERQLLAQLVEGTDAFVQVVGPDFRWLAINRAAVDEIERIYGVRPRVGDSFLDLFGHQQHIVKEVRAVWSRALAGEAFTEVGEFGDPDRERRVYEMKFDVLRDADGVQIAAYQFVTDVTERVREQERLAEAERARRDADELYRTYFENSPEALFVIGVEPDGDFVIEEINPAHEAGVGLKLADIRGRKISDILTEPVAAPILAAYTHVLETGALYQYREQLALGSEPTHWDTSLVPMRDETGRIVRIIGSSRNVTRQVMTEEALRQSQKMDAMGHLTGGVAHDFNNLLTPIVGALDLLQRKGLGGEREQRLIDGAVQSADRAKILVQRLLAFARRQPLQSVAVDVPGIVNGMADLVSSTAGPQIRVVVDVPPDLPFARADPNQLEMALLNLAVNARDAMPEGGTLRISAAIAADSPLLPADLQPGRYIMISVADSGVGMDEDTLARAVEPFFSTKGVGKGTGLGLSMVHGLASQLGGAITISSQLGRGTNVELWLPQTDETPESPGIAQPAALIHQLGTALLVDDEELVRASTADMLEDLGYRTLEASSGEAALGMIESGVEIDLVVTDHLMPGMTGSELARQIRKLRPGLPVLLVSGYAEVEGVAADLPRLVKPFKKHELASSIGTLTPEQG
ncbi:PAS domain-containing protein [Brevundimonas variabilis]|uniref:histidine kinase n=1 Tax=Brevundimonas variabilis TaxID=74312 RepID=A0A7W9CJK5_9CAUL|nr:PAS domain-containing protein [Brevundimonas variabilis]MBB5746372.1 PAS domain S-box-containing protein [Brevundimonas variabilis]